VAMVGLLGARMCHQPMTAQPEPLAAHPSGMNTPALGAVSPLRDRSVRPQGMRRDGVGACSERAGQGTPFVETA
jgi:hypothetical protein